MNNRLERPGAGMHPNAFIANNPDLQEIFCVYCGPQAMADAQKACDCHVCPYQGGYILLFTGEKPVAELETLFSARCAHAGICGPFARAASAYGCAEKAFLAAKSGAELEPGVFLHRYADIRFWAFVDLAEEIIRGDGYSIKDFCHNSVLDICEYDRIEGSSYRTTLMSYLRSGCNLRVAAEMVGVHRNTLAYRIRRLEELFDLDLSDSNTSFELLFSFTALEASGIDWDAYRKPETADFDASEISAPLWDLAERRTVREPPRCMCRLFLIDASELQEEEAAALFCAAESRFPDSAVAYNDSGIYILARDDRAYVDAVRSFSAEENRSGAASQPFVCNKLPLQAELLRHILTIAKQLQTENSFYLAKDYCSLAFFSYMQRRAALEPYYCDEVIRVMDNDYRKGTSFAKSLYMYLSSFMNMIGAAHEASVHRNTLEYQIKKALAIANVGAPDDKLRFEMMCTYKMIIVSGI